MQAQRRGYAKEILELVGEQGDGTLEELVEAMHKQSIPGSRRALWRFLERHGISLSSTCTSG
jgi:hypothetical protein